MKTQILIIGAGAVGTAIARELSKYRLSVLVVDKNEDVGGDCSKSNSAIIHTGYDAPPGTLESELVVAANPAYDRLAEDLDIPFQRVGALLPAVSDEQFRQLAKIREKAFLNKVYDVEYLSGEQLLALEPNLSREVRGGLYIPRESIIDPFLLVVAMAENALENGARFLLGQEVTGLKKSGGRLTHAVLAGGGEIEADYIVNAAGLHCDDIAGMAGKKDYYVNPRKGQFFILDKNTSCRVRHIILPIPTKLTKGKLMCPTIHGNMLLGPTAEDLEDKYDKAVTAQGLESIEAEVKKLVPGVVVKDAITQYCGLRANRNPEGLHIDVYEDIPNYVNLSGVRSTGLTASVSIGKYVARQLGQIGVELTPKENFAAKRKGIARFKDMSPEERERMIQQNPRYGKVVCRCETVTEGEILAALRAPIPARSMDAVKRRLRVGMGRCQGGFCGPRMLELLERELRAPAEEIRKNNKGSHMTVGNAK